MLRSSGSRVSPARATAVGAFLTGVAIAVYIRFGPYGFNPTDDGYIVSQSQRILDGAVPHADLLSPRPLGSAFLHTVDVLLPLPLYDATRLVFCLEMMLVAALLGWLLFGAPPWRWSAVEAIGVAGSALVNIHAFPLMPWHTVDGMLFAAAGLVVLDAALHSGRRRELAAAFVLLGLAPLMKQNYLAAPVLGLLWLGWARRTPAKGRTRPLWADFAVAVSAAAAPLLAYVVVVLLAGGLDDLVTQLAAAARTRGFFPVDVFEIDADYRRLIRFVAVVSLSVAAVRAFQVVGVRRRSSRPGVAAAFQLLALAASTAAAGMTLHAALNDRSLAYYGSWGAVLMWALAFGVVVDGIARARLHTRAASVVVLAVVSSLSWGYAVPNLVAGTSVLALLDLLLRGALPPRAMSRRAVAGLATATAALLFAFAAVRLVEVRKGSLYFDRPEKEATTALRPIDADFGRLRSTPATARYLRDLRSCIEQHPAARVAMLPDNPSLYQVFGVDNPFPIDWMLAPELGGVHERLVTAARRLDAQGDYLVIFQTFSAFAIQMYKNHPGATPESKPYDGSHTVAAMHRELHGETVACGMFVAVYSPAA